MLPFDPAVFHNQSSDDLVEIAAAFAVEALDRTERGRYARHLSACGVCRRLAAEYQQVADALPGSLEPRAASAGLKERVLAPIREHAAREREAAGGRRSVAAIAPTPVLRPRWGRRWAMPAAVTAAAAFAALLGAALAWNFTLRSENGDQAARLVRQEQMLDAIAAGGRVTQLKGTNGAPQASGTVIQSPSSRTAFLLVRDLPRLPENQEYQVWRIKTGTPSGAGLFSSEGMDEQMIVVSADFTDADAIGISIEPRGGSRSPTGAIVLLGT